MSFNQENSLINRLRLQRIIASLGLFSLVMGGTACSERRVTDFTIISTKNTLLLANADRQEERITGKDCHFLLFGMPDMKNAIDDAIEKAGPEYDALVDGVVTWQDDFFRICYIVEGTPIKATKSTEIWGRSSSAPNAQHPRPKPVPVKTSQDDS